MLETFSALLAAVSIGCLAAPPQPLPALNVDIKQSSVSGISSGRFMSIQFQIAHSSIIRGSGIVAGGPYYCSQNDVVTATTKCSCTGEPIVRCEASPTSAKVPALVEATKSLFEAKLIDDPGNVANQRVVTLAGRKDPLVPEPVAIQLTEYYTALGLPPQNVSAVSLDNAGHTMPTLAFGNACSVTDEPYIGKCQFDSAQAILSWIYGPLRPPASGKAKGRYIQFDQRPCIPIDGPFIRALRNMVYRLRSGLPH